MYVVRMTRTTATEARRRFFELLDAAERGEAVVLERRGVRFRISLDRAASAAVPRPSPLVVADPALLEGTWSWKTNSEGELTFLPGEDG